MERLNISQLFDNFLKEQQLKEKYKREDEINENNGICKNESTKESRTGTKDTEFDART